MHYNGVMPRNLRNARSDRKNYVNSGSQRSFDRSSVHTTSSHNAHRLSTVASRNNSSQRSVLGKLGNLLQTVLRSVLLVVGRTVRRALNKRAARNANNTSNRFSKAKTRNSSLAFLRKRSASKKPMGKARRRMYRRRRIMVAVVLLLMLALTIFCIISITRGIGAIGSLIRNHGGASVMRLQVPTPRPVKLIKRCDAHDLRLELSTKSQSVPMGGTIELQARVSYIGSASCVVDASPSQLVLDIHDPVADQQAALAHVKEQVNQLKDDARQHDREDQSAASQHDGSDNDQAKEKKLKALAVWRSDACPAIAKPLLMAKGDYYEKKFTWSTNTNKGIGCADDKNLPTVNRGSYTARLVVNGIRGLRSELLVITVT